MKSFVLLSVAAVGVCLPSVISAEDSLPFQHKVEVYLGGGDHIELQDGDTIDITVE